ncbi:MAG: ABC transporter substrate-binding protein, partial [Actinomycetia bacterium]|nr:ABC transporter substrate-binding protein [Actinomycetes bacterium]
NFASVKATDDTTLVIKTKEPQANLPYVSITRRGIPIVPEHIWSEHVDDLANFKIEETPVVGYGPWELVEYKPQQFERFEANEDFQVADHGPPAFDELVLNSFKNTDAAAAALRSGQIDYIRGLNPTQYEAIETEENIKAFTSDGDGWTSLAINSGAHTRSGKSIGTANPILADDKVRLAIHLAIDKEKLVDNVVAGLGSPGVGYLTNAYPQWSWDPEDDVALTHDPDKANAILDEAGYKMGDDGIRVDPKSGNKLEFRLGIHSDSASDAQIAEYLEGWFKDIGIAIKIEPMGFSKLNDDLAKGDWDMLMDGWRHGPDPSYLLSLQLCSVLPKDDGTGGNTDSFHCNPKFDELYQKQLTAFDKEERQDIVDEMQKILYEDNNNIQLYYSDGLNAVRTDKVDNLVMGSADDGNYPPQKVFWNYLTATPAESVAGSSSNTGWYVAGGAVVVLALAGGGLAMRRRTTADERE